MRARWNNETEERPSKALDKAGRIGAGGLVLHKLNGIKMKESRRYGGLAIFACPCLDGGTTKNYFACASQQVASQRDDVLVELHVDTA